MLKKITVTGANKVYFTVLAVFLFATLAIGIVGGFTGKDVTKDYFHVTILFTEFVLILVPVTIYTVRSRLNIREVFRINKLQLLPASIIILIVFPAIYAGGMFNSIILYLLQLIGDTPQSSVPAPHSIVQLIAGVAVVGLSPAICEEALHRGILLKAYEKRGSLKAVVISAIMFGFFHFDITNLLSPIFLGILIGYYVLRTNSIFAGVLAHFLHNSVLEIIDYLTHTEDVPQKISISAQELGQNMIFGIVSLVIIMLLLRLFKKVTEDTAIYNSPVAGIKEDIKSILSHWPVIASLSLYLVMAAVSVLGMMLSK